MHSVPGTSHSGVRVVASLTFPVGDRVSLRVHTPRTAPSERSDGTVAVPFPLFDPAVPARPAAATETCDDGDLLMIALQQGDRSALVGLVEIYHARLFHFVRRIVGDVSTTEDLIQETWMSLYERRQSYESTYRFSTWLFTIARRKALSELRRRRVRSIIRPISRSGEGAATEIPLPQRTFCDPDVHTDEAILAGMIERALAMIPPHQREIVMLRDVEGLENEEIAQVLGWNLKPGTIRKRVFDARAAFRHAMLSLGYDDTISQS